MDTVSYPDSHVAAFLNDHFVPVRVDINKAGKLADRWGVIWTPNLNVIDVRERCIARTVGWLPPAEMAAFLQTARGHFAMHRKAYAQAADQFAMVFDQSPRSLFAPEALYHRGTCRYLATGDVSSLKEDWIMLQRFYPHSEWAIKSNIL